MVLRPKQSVSAADLRALPMFVLVADLDVLLRHFDARAVVVLGFSAFAACHVGNSIRLASEVESGDALG